MTTEQNGFTLSELAAFVKNFTGNTSQESKNDTFQKIFTLIATTKPDYDFFIKAANAAYFVQERQIKTTNKNCTVALARCFCWYRSHSITNGIEIFENYFIRVVALHTREIHSADLERMQLVKMIADAVINCLMDPASRRKWLELILDHFVFLDDGTRASLWRYVVNHVANHRSEILVTSVTLTKMLSYVDWTDSMHLCIIYRALPSAAMYSRNYSA